MKRAIITVGLGFGDEGKGAAVDFLCRQYNADLVVRYSGGSQAGHNVVLSDGRSHTFSQFGAGTFARARTYLDRNVIINPPAMMQEAQHLEELGVKNPFDLLTVHPSALVTTFYTINLNRWREMRRQFSGSGIHGSCGHGIGETRSYWLKYGNDAIYAEDLKDACVLLRKLDLQRQRVLAEIGDQPYEVSDGQDTLLEELHKLETLICSWSVESVAHSLLRVPFNIDHIPRCNNMTIFEGAQGVLLDEWCGFHPHTTWSTVTQLHGVELARMVVDEFAVMGITRTYLTRHGAGPFPSETPELQYMCDVNNPYNEWQRSIRFGWLDIALLEYAVSCCNKTSVGGLSGIMVNCLDEVTADFRVCIEGKLPRFQHNLQHQQKLGLDLPKDPKSVPVSVDVLLKYINHCAPVVATGDHPSHIGKRIVRKLEFIGA